MTATSTELATRPTGDIFTADGFATTMKICEALVKSGILPRGVDTPFKAFAIVQKGREIGVGPMRALTGIHLIEGKPVVSPELKLEQFRERGGRVRWVRSDNTVAELWLKAPNGDEHTETVTMDDMKAAGVTGKDNWRKYPKSMLRARCVGFGLRALGEGDGSYTPDELGAVTDESGAVTYEPPEQAERPEDVRARAELRDRLREEAPRATATNAAPSSSAAPPPAPSARGGSVGKTSGAADIMHDGRMAKHEQVALIHILRSKIPTWDPKSDEAKSKWAETLGVYVKQPTGDCGVCKGSGKGKSAGAKCKACYGRGKVCPPVEHSNELSVAQASHLIDRLQARVDKLDRIEAEIRGTGPSPAAEALREMPPADLLEVLHDKFTSAVEETEWLNSIGFADADAVRPESRLIVSQLAAAWRAGPDVGDTYREMLAKARVLGHVTVTP